MVTTTAVAAAAANGSKSQGLIRPLIQVAKDTAIKLSENPASLIQGKRFVQTSSSDEVNKNSLYYNTFYIGSQLKNGIKGRIPPNIRKLSQSYHNRLNNASASTNEAPRSNAQLIKFIALFSVGLIFYTVTVKIFYQTKPCDGEEDELLPKKRDIKPSNSWGVFCYSTLPLNAISRLWGRVNSIDLPIWLREPCFKLYGYTFGVNFEEIQEADITNFKNLSEFFYREIKPEVRPVDETADIVCPSDGTVLQLGVIHDGNIEQVKGMTYSIDEFLGDASNKKLAAPSHPVGFNHVDTEDVVVKRHEEFAELNGISYTLDDIMGGEGKNVTHLKKIIYKDEGERGSVAADSKHISKVVKDLAAQKKVVQSDDKELFFAVIYLAPGDYHRYHSPTNWVVTLRRHFIGELFSVAPYFQRTLNKLFVLNERVALLGYWKYGFFSMIPVGATNVGSIKVNFDKDLATNTKYESAHYQDSELKRVKKNTCYEATYSNASKVLGGQPVTKGEEVGGFMLGSTVVLVFEAPKEFKFNINKGQKVKVGAKLGSVETGQQL